LLHALDENKLFHEGKEKKRKAIIPAARRFISWNTDFKLEEKRFYGGNKK